MIIYCGPCPFCGNRRWRGGFQGVCVPCGGDIAALYELPEDQRQAVVDAALRKVCRS